MSLNHPSDHISALLNFDDRANRIDLNMASLTLDYAPGPVGFHVDAGLGRAFDIMGSSEKDATGMRFFKQAYIDLKPASWKGLKVDAGRFLTFASAEVIALEKFDRIDGTPSRSRARGNHSAHQDRCFTPAVCRQPARRNAQSGRCQTGKQVLTSICENRELNR